MQTSTSQKWEGRWDQLVGRVKAAWAELTDDDLLKTEGDFDRLLGVIKERTGQTREEIESRLDN